MRSRVFAVFVLFAAIWVAAIPAQAQKVTKETLEGVTNFNML